MKRMSWLVIAAVTFASVVGLSATTSRNETDDAPVFVSTIPAGYRDWRLISVAREEGTLNDIRAVLGNDVAIDAYRAGKLPFPEGTIIARLAWSYDVSEENNKAFGQKQSYIAGHPKNGVQFMIKDAKKYAATDGWGYGHFENGKSAEDSLLKSCHPCHKKISERDYVFTRYAP
jgi:hypothetical protein